MKGKGNGRFPAGMTERKARATAAAKQKKKQIPLEGNDRKKGKGKRKTNCKDKGRNNCKGNGGNGMVTEGRHGTGLIENATRLADGVLRLMFWALASQIFEPCRRNCLAVWFLMSCFSGG